VPSRRHVLLVFATLFVVAILTATGVVTPAHAADRDCGDFATQRAAQLFFLDNSPTVDPHALDADGDGVACESNACPCLVQRAPVGFVGAAPTKRQVVQWARVTHVVDGDTIDVRLSNRAEKSVRLVGIDTPEVYGGHECGGKAASVSLTTKLPVGTRVKLLSDPSQAAVDRYGRLLRYVERVADGRDMNRSQVYDGHASVYVYDGVPFRRVSAYRAAQRFAQAGSLGAWGAC